MHNIVLIGMPGCGKSAIGQPLAEEINYQFVDLDAVIEKKFGAITTLFNQGEAFFRQKETEALTMVMESIKNQPMVLATGGGIVIKSENIIKIKEYGKIIYIRRSIDDIIKSITDDGRPWLEGDYRKKLEERFNERQPLYEEAADWTITNDQSMALCLEKIVNWIGETNDHIGDKWT
jgi:shikimate kinase